jgi:hypothetical protein
MLVLAERPAYATTAINGKYLTEWKAITTFHNGKHNHSGH